MGSVLLKLKVQPGLVVAHRAEDPPDWVFTLCKRGMQELLGRRLRLDEELLVRFTSEEVKELPNGG